MHSSGFFFRIKPIARLILKREISGSHTISIYIYIYIDIYIDIYIKTHDSESRGQEETAIIRETKNTRPLSELFTRKSVKKLTNALVKPP